MKKGTSNFRHFLVKTALCASFLLLLLSGSQVCATESGLGWYPDGLDDFKPGALPPPGVYFLNYAFYINISEYKDLRAGGIKLGSINADSPDVEGWSAIDALRLLYVTKKKLFGGDFGAHIIVPVQHLELTKAHWSGVPGGDLLATDDTHCTTDLKNITIGPAVGWHFSKNFHALAAVDITMPTGAFDENDLANTGTGYWTFTPLFSVTYITDQGYEVGAKLMYDINTTNTDTHYRSGQAFHTDYIVGKKVGNFDVGINGYFFVQVQDDSLRYEPLGFDGNKAEAFSIGPVVSYKYKNMFFKAKAQFDTYTKNRPETQRYWINWIYAF
jgi:hypothetical protein